MLVTWLIILMVDGIVFQLSRYTTLALSRLVGENTNNGLILIKLIFLLRRTFDKLICKIMLELNGVFNFLDGDIFLPCNF